jgi:gas vesicle protein
MSNSSFFKGLAVGVVAGTAVGLFTAPKRRDMKKAAGRFLKAAGGLVENFSGIWD